LSITAGEWDIIATVTWYGNGSTPITTTPQPLCVGSTSASAAGTTEGLSIGYMATLSAGKTTQTLVFPLSLTATTTYYLNAYATFSAGNPQFVCTLRAVRRR
jgi:hypothetical protein